MPKIQYRGKNIGYRTPATLARKLRITLADANYLINNPNASRFVKKNNKYTKIKLKDTPLLLQKFGVKRISNKKYISGTKIKNLKMKNELSGGDVVSVVAHVKGNFDKSSDVGKEFKHNISLLNVNVEDIQGLIDEGIDNYFSSIQPDAYEIDDTKITFFNSNTRLRLEDGRLRGLKIDISNLYNELVDIKNNGNCVRDTLKKYYAITHKKIDKLGNEDGVSIEEIKEFCIRYKIKMVLYNIMGKVISSFFPTKRNTRKNLIGICYNNHFYPVKNQTLNKKKGVFDKVKIIKNGLKKFKKIVKDQKQIPHDVKLKSFDGDNIEILSFIHNGVKYIDNEEYIVCNGILHDYGLDDHIHDGISLKNIAKIISKVYVKENLRSFLPNHNRFVKGGYTYTTDIEDDEYKNVSTLDKSKCYSYCLKELTYLIKCDYRTAVIEKNPTKIIPHHLYVVEPKYSSILLPDVNMYSGGHLLYCKEVGLKFKVVEGMSCELTENYYTNMVKDMYKKYPNEAKNIINIMIGQFENYNPLSSYLNIDKICNADEAERSEGVVHRMFDDVYAVMRDDFVGNIYTQKPISIQVKDLSRKVLYQKMLKLNLKEKDIVQIKTDSISFIDKERVYATYNDEKSMLNSWKYEEFKKLKAGKDYFKNVLSFHELSSNKNVIYQAYAGAGKTHRIINELIPSIKDYIVLSPSHASIKEYREAKLNCSTVQSYSCMWINKIPDEDIIIFDEHGLMDIKAHDLLYKCFSLGKTIYSFGDWQQLLPVGHLTHFNSPQYLDMIFSKKEEMNTNHRNDFTKEYYDSIINGTTEYGVKQVIKHSTDDILKADIILCYRNNTIDIYNQMKMSKLGFGFKSNICQVGVKIICKSNGLGDKHGIYNNYTFEIVSKRQGDVVMYKLDNGVELNGATLRKHFKPAYAMNAYGIQGRSVKSYHWATCDDKFLNPRSSYTIVSRLKTKNF